MCVHTHTKLLRKHGGKKLHDASSAAGKADAHAQAEAFFAEELPRAQFRPRRVLPWVYLFPAPIDIYAASLFFRMSSAAAPATPAFDVQLKVLLLGDSAVGKTCLLTRLCVFCCCRRRRQCRRLAPLALPSAPHALRSPLRRRPPPQHRRQVFEPVYLYSGRGLQVQGSRAVGRARQAAGARRARALRALRARARPRRSLAPATLFSARPRARALRRSGTRRGRSAFAPSRCHFCAARRALRCALTLRTGRRLTTSSRG